MRIIPKSFVVRGLFVALPFFFSGMLTAQDVAPSSLTGTIYITRQLTPREITLPVHAGVLAVDGKRYPIYNSSMVAVDDYSWVKTSRSSGFLTIKHGNSSFRLEVSFLSASEGTYRQQTEGTTEIATGEIYFSPIPPDPTPPLVNLSTRTSLTATQPAIAGFVVEGSRTRTVLIRAVGPTLSRFGVSNPVADPVLTVFKATATIAENSGWGGTAALAAAFTRVGAFELPASSRDCAELLTLEPGNYSARAASAAPGEVLLEIYYVD